MNIKQLKLRKNIAASKIKKGDLSKILKITASQLSFLINFDLDDLLDKGLKETKV